MIGLLLLDALGGCGISPMVLVFAGGLLLVGPWLLIGFFRPALIYANGRKPRLFDAFAAFVHAASWIAPFIAGGGAENGHNRVRRDGPLR